jgi:DNA polymerase I
VWPSGADLYPALLRAGVRAGRCHDVTLAERLLLGREGRGGEPATLEAAYARLRGAPVPAGRAGGVGGAQDGWPDRQRWRADTLFEGGGTETADASATLDALIAVHADQLRRIAADERPARFGRRRVGR